MSLRYALLAVLTSRPMTGYDVSKRFQTSVGHVWHAPDSQIYPELRSMERAGLLHATDVPWGSRGTKTLYSVTLDGVAAFRSWLQTPLDYSLSRDPVALKTAYMEWADPAALADQFRAHIAWHREQIDRWRIVLAGLQAHADPVLRARLSRSPDEDAPIITGYKVLAYEGLISRAEAEVAWAEHGLRTIDRLERGRPTPASRTATRPLASAVEDDDTVTAEATAEGLPHARAGGESRRRPQAS